ncbi:hypothetical protein Droror1_Dr00013991 [Drosera rotundifolia]
MRASSAIHSPHLFFPHKSTCFPITIMCTLIILYISTLLLPTPLQIAFAYEKFVSLVHDRFALIRRSTSLPAKVVCFQGKLAESELDGSSSLKPVAATLLIAEKEEAKVVLTLFLKQQGLSNSVAARTINKSDLFLEHLLSRLHSLHKTWYMTGRELTTMDLREALNLYLEALHCQHGDAFIDMVEHFPDPPSKLNSSLQTPPLELDPDTKVLSVLLIDSMSPNAMARVSDIVPADNLPPHVTYLIDLGLDLKKIQVMTRKFRMFVYYTLEGKVKPLVEFLIELGMAKSDISRVLYRKPQQCGISLSENLIPTMKFLEELGVDKQKWARMIYQCPTVLCFSRRKINLTLSFLKELCLSEETIGKIITRYPNIIGYNVEDKLRPAVEYFKSMGVNVPCLIRQWPQTLALSIEGNMKPTIEFFLEKGYSMEEIAMMINRFGALTTYSLSKNLVTKWDFFLSMGYPRSELVKFPQYFGYSLERRIKPRYALMQFYGVRLVLNMLLSLTEIRLDNALQVKRKKRENGDDKRAS